MDSKKRRFGAKFIEKIFGKTTKEEENSYFKKELAAPVTGKVMSLTELSDESFSSGTMGQGCAIAPSLGEVLAPCDGVVAVFPQECYVIGITSLEGIDIIIHVGLETIRLNGKHFTPKVKEGEKVKAGQVLLQFDIDALKKEGFSLDTSMVVSNTDEFESTTTIVRAGDSVNAGDTLLVVEN